MIISRTNINYMPALAVNKRAQFDYELSETFSAGLVLSGPEVKAAKAGQVSLKGSFVVLPTDSVGHSAPYLLNATIQPYKFAQQTNYDPTRSRALLLTKREVTRLIGLSQTKGLTLVPTRLYIKNNLIKLDFAVGRGRKKYDKREVIKKREIDRQLKQHLNN